MIKLWKNYWVEITSSGHSMSDEQIDNSLLDYDYEYLPDGFLFDKQNTV